MTVKKLSVENYVSNNLMAIQRYFDRAIRNKKLLVYENVAYEAKESFKKLPLHANEAEPITRWSEWIDQYISQEQWENCKTAIRQSRLMQKKTV